MKILAFAATNSRKSINRALIDFAARRLQAEVLASAEFELLDLNDFEMPIYSIDREQNGGSQGLAEICERMLQSGNAATWADVSAVWSHSRTVLLAGNGPTLAFFLAALGLFSADSALSHRLSSGNLRSRQNPTLREFQSKVSRECTSCVHLMDPS